MVPLLSMLRTFCHVVTHGNLEPGDRHDMNEKENHQFIQVSEIDGYWSGNLRAHSEDNRAADTLDDDAYCDHNQNARSCSAGSFNCVQISRNVH